MIAEVRSVLALLAEHLGTVDHPFPIFRKEQSAQKQVYPFASYKILSVSGDPFASLGQVSNSDTTKVTQKYRKTETAVVSLSFHITENAEGIPKPTIDLIYQKANQAIEFLQVVGSDSITELNLVVELYDTNIVDRTVYLDPIYEYQIGFDFRVRNQKELLSTVDAIDMDLTIREITPNFE